MARPGLVIQFKTKPDTAEQFNDILVAALEHVEAEAGTRPWLTLRAEQDPTVFYLVDLFDDEDARNIHLNGAAAELCRRRVDPRHRRRVARRAADPGPSNARGRQSRVTAGRATHRGPGRMVRSTVSDVAVRRSGTTDGLSRSLVVGEARVGAGRSAARPPRLKVSPSQTSPLTSVAA